MATTVVQDLSLMHTDFYFYFLKKLIHLFSIKFESDRKDIYKHQQKNPEKNLFSFHKNIKKHNL